MLIGGVFWLALLLAACTPLIGGAADPIPARQPSDTTAATLARASTHTRTPTPEPDTPAAPSPTPTASATPSPTTSPTPTLTPIPPDVFTTTVLRNGILPQTYLADACENMRLRWSPQGSPPDTVVVPIMFHSIVKSGRPLTANHDISEQQFRDFVDYAKYLGYETITTAEFDAFLHENAPIPPRSMLLIVDDRRPGVVQDHFLPVLRANNWTVTLGWISAGNGPGLWAQMEGLNETGLLDVQSHGFRHLYINSEMDENEIREEITASISILEEHFGRRPLAYVWPGGNYSPLAVEIARDAGYRLGFTVHSPMPVMFNWVPLVPEAQEIGDPLMVLPRAWSPEANLKLDQAIQVAEQARLFAIENYPAEAAWYRAACGDELPPLEVFYPDPPPATNP